MSKKIISLLIIACLLLVLPIQAFAAKPETAPMVYLNLGDSIAAGTGVDPGESYYALYSGYLADGFGAIPVPNAGYPGLDSSNLLLQLQMNADLRAVVSSADIITVSIGANNLLGPIIAAANMAYALPMNTSAEVLESYIAAGGAPYWNLAVAQITQQARNPASLGGVLAAGSQAFVTEWPLILEEIYEVNPDANVVALTLYNPVEKSENADLYNLIEELIAPMNQALRDSRSNKCSLANVYNAFRKDNDAVGFSLAWQPQLNPHPTELGQQLIFDELAKARNPMAFQ